VGCHLCRRRLPAEPRSVASQTLFRLIGAVVGAVAIVALNAAFVLSRIGFLLSIALASRSGSNAKTCGVLGTARGVSRAIGVGAGASQFASVHD
jgi:hypothetical protein